MISFNWEVKHFVNTSRIPLNFPLLDTAPASNIIYCMLHNFNNLTYHYAFNIFKPSIAKYCCIFLSEKH